MEFQVLPHISFSDSADSMEQIPLQLELQERIGLLPKVHVRDDPSSGSKILYSEVSSLSEITRLVRASRTLGLRVRSSNVPCCLATDEYDVLVNCDFISDQERIETFTLKSDILTKEYVKVKPGVTVQEFNEFCLSHDLCLPSLPDTPMLTMAELAMTGAHGIATGFATVSDFLTEIRIVDADGYLKSYRSLTDEEEAGELFSARKKQLVKDLFSGAKCSLGMFGIVYDATFEVFQNFTVSVKSEFLPLEEIMLNKDNLKKTISSNSYVSLFWFPFNSIKSEEDIELEEERAARRLKKINKSVAESRKSAVKDRASKTVTPPHSSRPTSRVQSATSKDDVYMARETPDSAIVSSRTQSAKSKDDERVGRKTPDSSKVPSRTQSAKSKDDDDDKRVEERKTPDSAKASSRRHSANKSKPGYQENEDDTDEHELRNLRSATPNDAASNKNISRISEHEVRSPTPIPIQQLFSHEDWTPEKDEIFCRYMNANQSISEPKKEFDLFNLEYFSETDGIGEFVNYPETVVDFLRDTYRRHRMEQPSHSELCQYISWGANWINPRTYPKNMTTLQYVFDVGPDYENFIDSVNHVTKRVKEYKDKGLYPLNGTFSVTFTKASSALMAPTFCGNELAGGSGLSCTITLFSISGLPGQQEFLTDFEMDMRGIPGARPHWNIHWTTIDGTHSLLRSVYGDCLDKFKTMLRKQLIDLDGVFLNDHLAKVIDSEGFSFQKVYSLKNKNTKDTLTSDA